MHSVTITQITPPQLEGLFENTLRKILSQYAEQPAETDSWSDLNDFASTIRQTASLINWNTTLSYYRGLIHLSFHSSERLNSLQKPIYHKPVDKKPFRWDNV
jgi:hypothetical protein